MENKENKEYKVIPFIYPTNYHLSPFEEGFDYDSHISQIGVMRDAMEKALSNEEEPWMI